MKAFDLTSYKSECYIIISHLQEISIVKDAGNMKIKKQLNQQVKNLSLPGRSIFRWFFVCLFSIVIIFCIMLFPLFHYCKNIFSELKLEQARQQLDIGVTHLENTVTTIASTPEMLTNDTRFIAFRYKNPDYASIDFSVRKQLMDYINSLFFSSTLISDYALQFTDNIAVTSTTTFFDGLNNYYPDYFCIAAFTYEEWEEILQTNKSGFLPVYHIKTQIKEYDALIYAVPWGKHAYFYVCINIADVKKEIIADSYSSIYYLSISDAKGNLLYTDLPADSTPCRTITQKTSTGSLSVTIHIPEPVFTENLKPLYFFLVTYFCLSTLILICSIFIYSKLSTKPLMHIVDMLEHNNKLQDNDNLSSSEKAGSHSILYGFHFIQNHLKQAASSLEHSRNVITSQQNILQARFFEKAISGSLITDQDIELFYSYFPGFPKEYRLVQLKLFVQNENEGILYADALSTLQSFLQSELTDAYCQQMNESELLLITAQEDYADYCRTLNFAINNINQLEPCYRIKGIASDSYHHPEELSSAYQQLQALDGLEFPEASYRVCTLEDRPHTKTGNFHTSNTLALYTAISYGNREMALQTLQSYADALKEGNRYAYELIRSILQCINLEHPIQLMYVNLPAYSPNQELYELLKETVCTFCSAIWPESTATTDPFVAEVMEYIDEHYTENSLCQTTLEDHFKCSSSKIQKAFKNNMDITVFDYIKKKRMELANELLLQNEKSISEIAQKCGFTNSNSFYKAYQSVYGFAPSITKESYKKNSKF